ncbi:MAG: hypothetical protein KDD65_09170 [Bacteroidetes bacterium]|nr:hypothetical protein [Bacteroidota bacterium]
MDSKLKINDAKVSSAATTEKSTDNARKAFVVPRLRVHDNLPVITAGSVNLW